MKTGLERGAETWPNLHGRAKCINVTNRDKETDPTLINFNVLERRLIQRDASAGSKDATRAGKKQALGWNLCPGAGLGIGDLQGNQGAADGASHERRESSKCTGKDGWLVESLERHALPFHWPAKEKRGAVKGTMAGVLKQTGLADGAVSAGTVLNTQLLLAPNQAGHNHCDVGGTFPALSTATDWAVLNHFSHP